MIQKRGAEHRGEKRERRRGGQGREEERRKVERAHGSGRQADRSQPLLELRIL